MYLAAQDLADRGIAIDALRVEAMIEDVEARAALVAPCLGDPDAMTELQRKQVRAILADVLDRRAQNIAAGATTTSKTAGIYSESVTVSTEVSSRALFWPSEIADLQGICAAINGQQRPRGAFSVDLLENHEPDAGAYRHGVYGRPGSPVHWGQ